MTYAEWWAARPRTKWRRPAATIAWSLLFIVLARVIFDLLLMLPPTWAHGLAFGFTATFGVAMAWWLDSRSGKP